MKIKIKFISFALFVVAGINTTLAFAEKTLNMNIANNTVIRSVSGEMYGFNNEWHNTDDIYLADDYGKINEFCNDFEKSNYHTVPAEYAELYTSPDSMRIVKYIKNGSAFSANASSSSVMFDGYLYENQYDQNGVLRHPVDDVFSVSDNKASFEGYMNPELYTGGLEGWYGFSDMYNFQFRDTFYTGDCTNMTVVEETDNNHALHMKLQSYIGYAASYFGKGNISILDKTSCLSFRLKIPDASGDVRLELVQDGDLGNVKTAWERGRYVNVGTAQFLTNGGKAAWHDAVTLRDGKIYLGDTDTSPVGFYETNKWYTLKYYLNTEDISKVKNMLEVVDENGSIIAASTDTVLVPKPTSDMNIGVCVKNTLSFDTKSDYAYIISAGTESSVECYIDDITFETIRDSLKVTESYNLRLIRDMEEYPFGFSRMAGASAMTFDWKKSRGDLMDREPYEWTDGITEPAFCGIAEWVKTTKAANDKAKFSYVINLFDKDDDIVDLIEYMLAESGEDLNEDGVFWGDIRRADGIYEPVDISFWELGNEMDMAYGWDVDRYAARCSEVIRILKKYSPDIPIAVHSPTNAASEFDRYNWCYSLFCEVGNEVDYVTLHNYYLDDSFMDTGKYINTIDGAINCTYSHIMSFLNTKKWPHIRIMVTEHSTARYLSSNGLIGGDAIDINDRTQWHRNYDLGAAVSNAEFYNRMLYYPIVEGAYYHSQSDSGPWQLIYTDTDGIMKPTLPYEIMKLYNDYGTGEVLGVSLDGFSADKNTDTTAAAVRNADGNVNLFFTNRSSEAVTVSITGFDEDMVLKTTITSESLDDYNYTEIYEVDKREEIIGFSGRITLPAYSVVVLIPFEKNTVVCAEYKGERTVTAYGNTDFPDTDAYLMIIKDGTVKYFAADKTDKNGNYRFCINVDFDITQCEVKLVTGDSTDLTGNVKRITSAHELFNVETNIEISDSAAAQVKITNPYSLYGAECDVVLAEYKGDELVNVAVLEKTVLSQRDNVITVGMDYKHPYNTFKVFVWTGLSLCEPFGE